MDLDRVAFATSVDGKDREAAFNFTFQLGALSSALEHAVPEQMFVTEENPGEAVSAVKALQKASAEGQRIYHITQANQAEALPNIRQNSLTMQEIRSALAVGKEVIVHTDPISVPGWTGAGYVIFDPEVGDGAWKIGGGANGGWMIIAMYILIIALALTLAATNPLAAIFLTLQLKKFAERVGQIAAAADSGEHAYQALNKLLFITTVTLVLTIMGPVGKVLTDRATEFTPFAFLTGFLALFAYGWYVVA